MNENHENRNPLRSFSYPARVLIVACVPLMLVGFYFSIENEVFPSGSYPLIVLLLPGIGIALTLFIVGCVAFKILRIPILRPPPEDDTNNKE